MHRPWALFREGTVLYVHDTANNQERIRIKKRGRACNLNWAEFLNCTPTPTTPVAPKVSSSQQLPDSKEQLRMMNSQLTKKIKELECHIRQLEHDQLADNLLIELDSRHSRTHGEVFNGYCYGRVYSTCTTFVLTIVSIR